MRQFVHWLQLTLVLGALAGGGCAATWKPAPRLPRANEMVKDQLIVHSDFRLPRSHRLVDDLTALRIDIARILGTPLSDEPIHVFLFESGREYDQFIQARFPQLPERRAWFVETDTRLAVFAYWGDNVADDLRHELSHGYLHASTPNIPLWLDEGLAEYFESPRNTQGRHAAHIDRLARRYNDGLWTPDLKRLERMKDSAEMSPTDYAECWAWVRFLLDSSPTRRALLQDYLARLRMAGVARPLSEFLGEKEPRAANVMLDHLREQAAP